MDHLEIRKALETHRFWPIFFIIVTMNLFVWTMGQAVDLSTAGHAHEYIWGVPTVVFGAVTAQINKFIDTKGTLHGSDPK